MSDYKTFEMPMLLPLNIQMFSDDFYLSDEERDALLNSFNQEQQVEQQSDEEETDEQLESDEVSDEQVESESDNEEETEEEQQDEQQDHLSDDQKKRDAAFAEMRRQNEALAQQAAFVKQMAEHYGMTPEQLQEQWANDRLEKQAEEQGVPVEVLRKQNQLESEVTNLRQQTESQRVQTQVLDVMSRYGATEADINAAIEYANVNNLTQAIFSGAIPFEQAFKLANMDSLIQKAEKDAVQKNLSDKKKRQQAAQPSPKGGTANAATDEDDLDAKAAAYAAELIKNDHF